MSVLERFYCVGLAGHASTVWRGFTHVDPKVVLMASKFVKFVNTGLGRARVVNSYPRLPDW